MISGAVAVYILANQRLALPGWVPVVGKDFFVVEAELSTAQAVTPGQGQTVNIAGVEVGEISSVELEEGKAIVTLRLEPRYGRVYKRRDRAAAAEDRPQGHGRRARAGHARRGPRWRTGERIPVSQTLPDVNLDEILAVARRRHARLPDRAARRRRRGRCSGNGRELAERDPPLRAAPRATARKVFGALAVRRENIKRVIHNFSLVIDELGAKDDQLAEFVDNSNAVFTTLARQDANLRATLSELPSALDETQRGARQGRRRWPTSSARRCRRCGPARARSARRCGRCARS